MKSYKDNIPNSEPIGAFVNDNIMVTTGAYVAETTEKAVASACQPGSSYLVSNVYRYHDTFPHPPEIPNWPELIPDLDAEGVKMMMDAGGAIVGTPDQCLAACQRWADAGVDQLVFGIGPTSQESTLKTIDLLGKHVIPKLDKDPEFRTDKFKKAAAK